MRFARQARIFRGPLDPAPVASVLMLLVIFIMMSSLLYTPGVLIRLPDGDHLTVTDNPTIVVGLDSAGQCYFDNGPVAESELRAALRSRLSSLGSESNKLTMILRADKETKNEMITHVEALAKSAGIPYVLIAEWPPAFGSQR
ncbi:MAG TPA: biopolymer transporter ExbD [Verrucomicrobiae bacterium]|jgi:biopolymer transport protein ExbD|nr:biopolymer transporter ExbD [Verrucomicrobiae bacterium]